MITQMSKGKLREDRNLTWSKRAKAYLIVTFSMSNDRETEAYRSFDLTKCFRPEVSEKLPQG